MATRWCRSSRTPVSSLLRTHGTASARSLSQHVGSSTWRRGYREATPLCALVEPADVGHLKQRPAQFSHNSGAPSDRLSGNDRTSVDVVLSSGFLAFAAHSGFLQAVQDRGLRVNGVMGTSAGALTGALFAAGYAPADLASVLSERTPLSYLALNAESLHSGVFRLDRAIARLRELLPATFEELPIRFACGVIDVNGRHVTVSSGPLPEAVAASFAIPCLFAAVDIPGRLVGGPYADGGKVDRVGLRPWRQLLGGGRAGGGRSSAVPTICHVIQRSSPFSGDDDVAAAARMVSAGAPVLVVHSPRSRQSLLGLTDFGTQFHDARLRATQVLDAGREELLGEALAAL